MRRVVIEEGDREVQPHHTKRGSAGEGAKARRKQRRAEEARRVAEGLRAAARARGEAWADELPHPNLVFQLTAELAEPRRRDALLRGLGYRLKRSHGGHLIYGHASEADLVCAATPSDHRSWLNFLGEVRRRHPEAFRVAKAAPGRRNRRKPRRAVRPILFEATEPIARALELNVAPMRCTSCARPWQPKTVVKGRPPTCNHPLVIDERREEAA